MRGPRLLAVVAALACTASALAAPRAGEGSSKGPDLALLPGKGQIENCSVVEPGKSFAGEDLYKLIDGGAVRFLDRGFEWVVAGSYDCTSGGRIALEIYRMRSPAAAKGIFEDRSGASEVAAGIGDGSRKGPGFVEFHRGSFFVAVSAFDQGPEPDRAVVAFAGAVASRLEHPPNGR